MPSNPSKRVSVGSIAASSCSLRGCHPASPVAPSIPSPNVAEHTEVRVGTKFLRAAQWAADRHAEYANGLPGVPSVAQVLGLATLVLEDGGSEREAIAAMVLDALDDEVPRKELRAQFGKKVTRLVVAAHAGARHDRTRACPARRRPLACTLPTPRSSARHRGRPAKRCASAAACILQETRTLLRELRRNGTIAFVRCPAPPAEHLGHLHELVAVISRRRPRTVAHPGAARRVRRHRPAHGAGDRHPRVAGHPRRFGSRRRVASTS